MVGWIAGAAAALAAIVILSMRRRSRESVGVDVGEVSEAWLAEQRGTKEGDKP